MTRMRAARAVLSATVILSGCSDPSSGTTVAQPTGTGASGTGESGPDDGSTGASVTDESGTGATATDETTTVETWEGETDETGDEMDGHGTIRIEVEPLDGDLSIFDGTARVRATVNYESCLREFYLINQPTFVQDGPDGMPVFGAWVDKLCTDFDGTPDCTVESIQQSIIDSVAVYSLSVEYAIGDPTTIANQQFHVGPLPTSALAGCPAQVEVRQPGLIGFDANGNQIWIIATLPASNVAQTDQNAPVRVEVQGV